jgi:hypothetical protein
MNSVKYEEVGVFVMKRRVSFKTDTLGIREPERRRLINLSLNRVIDISEPPGRPILRVR